ncbi:hypothetical protein GF318_00980 [Candidatus Micrarchaeota archaeon]|nr:hypothetical protein [Candidatus Micrarchaeota archaeon]
MTSKNYVFGAVLLLLLAASVFAGGFPTGGDSSLRESQVVVTPVEDEDTVLHVSVMVFNPATGQSGTDIRLVMQEIVEDCEGDQACIMEEANRRTAASAGYNPEFEFLSDARITVEYYNTISGSYTPVQGCSNRITSTPGTATTPSATDPGGLETVSYYYAECDFAPAVEGQPGRTTLRINYDPEPGQDIRPSRSLYYFNNVRVPAAEQFTKNLRDLIVAQISGVSTSPLCLGVFMILGLLLASLYFAGKSPITLLDITTPRMPQPKGVAAGGQVLMPFGYTELKRTTRGKMGKAAGAALLTARGMSRRMAGDATLDRLKRGIKGLKGTAGDRAAGDVEEGKKIAEAAVTAGRQVGMSTEELEHLAGRLPYHWDDRAHRTVAQIVEALEAKGGKNALLAMTLKDYMLGQRTYQSLEAITGHNDVGKRDAFHSRVTSKIGKAFGANRYAVIGGFAPAMYDSTIRTGKVAGRMTKQMAKGVPELARGVTRTTMGMVGGRRAVEQLEERAKTSATAAWLTKKHPSDIVVGQMFPVNDKMAHLYRTLRKETLRDEMRYVLRQLYRKMGIKFNISEHELAEMGYRDLDILKRSGYTSSEELRQLEGQIRKILTGSGDGQQKLSALLDLAKSRGATVDGELLKLANSVQSIEQSAHPDHVKLLLLQEELEQQNKVRMSVNTGGMANEDAYLCHVGGDSLKGSQIWETMIFRTYIWDAENGHLAANAGMKEELLSARLNVANRIGTLNPVHGAHELPEHMRNMTQLEAVAERNRKDMITLFSEDGRKLFQQTNNKSINNASMNEIVQFMYGGNMPKTGHIDPKTKKMVWWGADEELTLPKGSTLVDMKRHWVSGLDPRENYAIGQWVESRFTKSYVPPYQASIEAELDRAAGSANWTVQQRTSEAKKLWVLDQLQQDMEQRFNSHFGHNTYGTTAETVRFYGGIMAGFMEKALKDKGFAKNNPTIRFLEEMDTTNPRDLSNLSNIMQSHQKEYEALLSKPVTYDDVAKTNQALVMLHEGGFAFYKKNMMLSDQDRVLSGEVALRDEKGQLRKFIPEDIPIKFGDRDDLLREFYRVAGSQNTHDWDNFIGSATKWAKGGGYNYEKEKVFAAVLWQYANTTHDYERFWRNSSVSVEAKRQVTPSAPSPMRFFGVEAPGFTSKVIKPFRDMGMHAGDYISKTALAAGGPLHKASYDITPVSEYYRQHSWQLSNRIMSGRDMQNLTEEEKVAYRNVAMQHYSYHQVWDFAIDRNPWRMSTSFGQQQSWQAFFHYGPSANFDVRSNLRAYMDRGEYASFMAGYGFPMNLAGKMMRPYTGMIRGLQMSMQGAPAKFDATGDALRQFNYTPPRLREAMQSLNPFSFKWFPGKTSERISKLNKFGGSLEQHQLAGPEFAAGLRQAPQDVFLHKKGVYANARTGEVNPGASFYNYRHEMQLDAPMAEYMLRANEATYMHDKKVQEAAWTNTTRRTVSAEALALRRDQELRGFGAMQNPLMGWANPIAFMWHMPVPLYPTSLTPRDMVSNYVRRAKEGRRGGYGQGLKSTARSLGRGTSRLMQPHKLHMVVYCPRCSRAGVRGSRCSCGTVLY